MNSMSMSVVFDWGNIDVENSHMYYQVKLRFEVVTAT